MKKIIFFLSFFIVIGVVSPESLSAQTDTPEPQNPTHTVTPSQIPVSYTPTMTISPTPQQNPTSTLSPIPTQTQKSPTPTTKKIVLPTKKITPTEKLTETPTPSFTPTPSHTPTPTPISLISQTKQHISLFWMLIITGILFLSFSGWLMYRNTSS